MQADNWSSIVIVLPWSRIILLAQVLISVWSVGHCHNLPSQVFHLLGILLLRPRRNISREGIARQIILTSSKCQSITTICSICSLNCFTQVRWRHVFIKSEKVKKEIFIKKLTYFVRLDSFISLTGGGSNKLSFGVSAAGHRVQHWDLSSTSIKMGGHKTDEWMIDDRFSLIKVQARAKMARFVIVVVKLLVSVNCWYRNARKRSVAARRPLPDQPRPENNFRFQYMEAKLKLIMAVFWKGTLYFRCPGERLDVQWRVDK